MIIEEVGRALRMLWRSPGRSGVVVFVSGIGIGIATALFAVVHGLATRPATGIPPDDALVRVRGFESVAAADRRYDRALSSTEVEALQAREDVFDAVAAWTAAEATVTTEAGAPGTLATVSFVTEPYFRVLGVRPVVGRALGPADAGGGGETPAVIAHELWTGLFGAAPDALGRSLRVDDATVTVVGVAPPGFVGPNQSDRARAVWLPLSARSRLGASVRLGPEDEPGSTPFSVVARLAPGVTTERASAVAAAVAVSRAVPAAEDPGGPATVSASAEVVPLLAYNETALRGANAALGAVSTLAVLILLIAGTNASVLLAAAASTRRRDIAVRLSLGASRARVVGRLLIESVLLSGAGGALGIVGLSGARELVSAPHVRDVLAIDWVAFTACAAAVGVVGVLSGLSPALSATRASLFEALGRGSGTTAAPSPLTLTRRLVVVQIAVTQPLLLGVAALATIVAGTGPELSPPAVADHVLVVDANRIDARVETDRLSADVARLVARLRELPEVSEVVSQRGGFSPARFRIPAADRPSEAGSYQLHARVLTAAPGYFELMGMPLVRGRSFDTDDRDVAVIGADLARRLWGSADPVGRLLRFAEGTDGDGAVTVVGVLDRDAASRGARGPGWPVWVPPGPDRRAVGIFHTLYVRTIGPAARSIPEVTKLLRSEAPALRVDGVATLADTEHEARKWTLAASGAAAAGGLVALLLASLGLFAASVLAVRQRTREIGIRIAIGSRAWQVQRLLVSDGLRLSVVGLALGLPLSALALRWLAAEVRIPSAALVASVAGIVLAVTALATWLPARRAASVDPSTTLRVG